MADAEAYVNYLKQETYSDQYLDKMPLSNETRNILANVVPLIAPTTGVDDFFGPYVCNVIVLTGNYKWDEVTVSDAKSRILEVYDKFTKYECHFIIDKSEANIQCMSDSDKDDLSSRIDTLCGELADVGFFNHGALEGGELTAEIDKILKAFYGK
jgi:hypothetical protein